MFNTRCRSQIKLTVLFINCKYNLKEYNHNKLKMSQIFTTENKLFNILNEQRKSGQFCDVIIKINSEIEMWAHFCVIAAQSTFVGNKYFVQQSSMQFSVFNPLKIEILNFECQQCLSLLLDFIYTKEIVVEKDHEEHIKLLSRIMELNDLQDVLFTEEVPVVQEVVAQTVKPERIVKKPINSQIKTKPTASISKKMHSCHGCKFQCYKPAVMILHILHSCENESSKCALCDIDFQSNDQLKDHILQHDNDKPFFCADCNQRFVSKTALSLHTPKHSSETPYMCTHCGKQFKWKHGLNSHLVVHSNEKKLLCDECGYSTAHLKTLKAHKLGHSGDLMRCTVAGCTHTSKRKENLKIHIAGHRNRIILPFVCEICGHRFSQNKNLKRHALLHISKNLHKCPHCSFGSHRTDKLREHISRQHTEKPIQLELPDLPQNSFDTKIEENDSIFTSKKTVKRKVKIPVLKPPKIATQRQNLVPILPKLDSQTNQSKMAIEDISSSIIQIVNVTDEELLKMLDNNT